MSWSVPTPIAVPGTAARNSLAIAGIPPGGGGSGTEYVFWVDSEGRLLVSRRPGLDPVGAPVEFFTPFLLDVRLPVEPEQLPRVGTSRIAALGTEDMFLVAWVAADGTVQFQQHHPETMGAGSRHELGIARRDSPLAAVETRPWKTFAWVTPEGRLGTSQFLSDAIRREAVLGEPGSVRADTPIAITSRPGTAHLLWVRADGTLVTSARRSVGETGWSPPVPIRDESDIPAAVGPGDALAATEQADTPEAVWLNRSGALVHARLGGETWGPARPMLSPGLVRSGGPLRVLSDSGDVEVIFAAPDGGIATAGVVGVQTLTGPTENSVAELEVSSLGQGDRVAFWATADGSLVRTRRRPESFGALSPGPRPAPLQVVGDVRLDPASARCDLRPRHADAADAFWVRPDGALTVLSGRNIVGGPPALARGWRWRAAAVARPGLIRTNPPGAVARLPRDPTGFALIWVAPDGSVRHIAFDGTDLVESPAWRLPMQIAPPGAAATDRPAVAATPGPPGAPAGQEWAFWVTPTRSLGVGRREDAGSEWTIQHLSATVRAESTLLAGRLPGRVTLVWVEDSGVPVFASRAIAAGSDWVLSRPPPDPRTRLHFTVAPRGRLLAAPVGGDSATAVAWVDVDGVVRIAVVAEGAWGEAAQRSHPGVADAASLSLLHDATLAWVLPDGAVAQEGRPVTGPGAARAVLGSVPGPPGSTSVVVATPDGNLGLLERGAS